jgi:acyl-CoA synthetase (AMP-forming)/AMP-acid ligase II
MSVRHPELVIAGAVTVSLPMVPGILNGDISSAAGGERFLIALIGCWILGSVLSWVTTTYSEQSRRAELMRLTQPRQLPTSSDPNVKSASTED